MVCPTGELSAFYDQGKQYCQTYCCLCYSGILGKIMDNLFLGRVVESTLRADLERLRDYAMQV